MKLLSKPSVTQHWMTFLLTALCLLVLPALSSAAKIGDNYGGGIVFFVEKSGQHGLIAAKADIAGRSSGSVSDGRFIWPDAQEKCNSLVSNGYSDWFLPNREQLKQLYLQKSIVGGFTGTGYWSSTMSTSERAWAQLFSNGIQLSFNRFHYFVRVRAVRAF